MKTYLIIVTIATLAACAAYRTDIPQQPSTAASKATEDDRSAACRRSPYCSTTKPDTMTPDRREAELRGVREAVEEAQKP